MSRNTQRMGDVMLAISLITLIFFPHVLISVSLELLHLLVEFLDITFEATEATLDFLIEHLLHTGLHNTQIIVFYLMLAGIFYGLYQFWLRLPALCFAAKEIRDYYY